MQIDSIIQTPGNKVPTENDAVCPPRGVPGNGDLHWRTVTFASVLSPGLASCYVALLHARASTGAVGVRGVAFKGVIRGEGQEEEQEKSQEDGVGSGSDETTGSGSGSGERTGLGSGSGEKTRSVSRAEGGTGERYRKSGRNKQSAQVRDKTYKRSCLLYTGKD